MASESPRLTDGQSTRRRKIIAVAVVIALIVASGAFVWITQFKSWSIRELADHVVNDPTANAPGFDHDLAGKSVTVKGKVTWKEVMPTTQGDLTFFSLDDARGPILMQWGNASFEVGDRISTRLHFEWSHGNDEAHVYSPQSAFPSLQWMMPIATIIKSTSLVSTGTLMMTSVSDLGDLVVTIADQVEHFPLGNISCRLSAGTATWETEYIQSLGFPDPNQTFGRPVDEIASLAGGEGTNHLTRFIDADRDGNLSRGDRFELQGLETPTEESGYRSYLLTIEIPYKLRGFENVPSCMGCYFVLNNRGLLMPTATHYARPILTSNATEARYTFESVVGRIGWNDLEILLQENIAGYVTWHLPDGALSGGLAQSIDLGFQSLGALSVDCVVDDLLGNGRVDEGDSVILTTLDGQVYAPTTNYTLAMIYEPSGESIYLNQDLTFHG